MSPLLASVGVTAALAGPAQDLGAEFQPDALPPVFGLACAPLRETVQFGDALGSFADDADSPELQMLLEAARNPAVDTVEGIDVDGGFAMVAGPGGASVVLPMKGDMADALALFLRDDEGPEDWVIDGNYAERVDPDGARRILTTDGRQARLKVVPAVDVTLIDTPVEAPSALSLLPDGDGCALWMQPPSSSPTTPALLRNPIALWIPFDDSTPIRLNVALPPHRDRAAKPEVVPPTPVFGPMRPQAVITLGVPVLSILNDPVVQDSLPPQVRMQLPEGGIAENVGAGTVVGTFFGQDGPGVVAVIPITKKNGRPVWSRRIWKITSDAVVQAQEGRGGLPPERIGRRSLQVQVTPRHTLTMVAQRGRLVVGNVHGQVEGVASGEGVAWLDTDQSTWASDHAVSVFGEAPLPGLGMPLGVQVGAGTRDDVLQLELLLEPGLLDPRVVAALKMMATARKAGGMKAVPSQ